MPAPTVKHKGIVKQTSDTCVRCPHLMSVHDEAKARQCNSCACVAQDTN